MFKRIRQLHISLAKKCQLLFGAAVVLIIAAAVAVPVQRMEQLTNQLNERSARTLTDFIVAEHVANPPKARSATTRGTVAVIPPTTQPLAEEPAFAPPRLILTSAGRDLTRLTPFEKKAAQRLRVRDREWISTLYQNERGEEGYRLVRIDSSCAKCHQDESPQGAVLLGLVSVDIPSQIETNQLLLNRTVILAATVIAGTLAIIVFYLITTRLILQPVRVLQETAQKVSEGDLNIRSDISTGDEFQQLSETFNQMLTNLKLGADQLRAANKSLDLRLGQMAEANSALNESNRLKSEFLANVSHELRTPLNSILGFADLLKDSTLCGDPKAARYLQNILNSGRNLLDLINDLLDLAKIEAGRMDVRCEPLSLSDLFEGLVTMLKPLLESKSLSVSTTVAPDVPILNTDPSKLQQVLYNFLSNAIKFSPTSGKIDLCAENHAEGVRISVTDQGPGIPADQHDVIFEKFRQADASVTRTHSGTGLGLAISKELTTLLGGQIGLRSEPGAGSTFWVTLPLTTEAPGEEPRRALVLT